MVSHTKGIKPPGLGSSTFSNGNEHREEVGLNLRLETGVIYYAKGIFGDYEPTAES